MKNKKDYSPIQNFDWGAYENGFNGVNLVPNPKIKRKKGEVVYCHEPYAEEFYKKLTGSLGDKEYTPKDIISGNVYNIKDIRAISDHEVMVDTDNGMAAVIDMEKEHQFIEHFGCNTVEQFIVSLKNPENKKIVLDNADTIKVVSKRFSLWDGVMSKIEQGFMDQLKPDAPKYAYEAKIVSVNEGVNGVSGYTVDINGVKCFLPGSLAASGPINDFNSLVGTTINVCIVNYSQQTNNFVVSHKKYLELTLPARVKEEIYPGLRISVKVTGQSKNGLFCAIKDENGEYPFASLMHRSTMSSDMESSFDKGDFVNGDIFIAYVHRIDWDENGNYRIVIGDQVPDLSGESTNENEIEN